MVREKKSERRVGLARALSKLGYCSRSQATQLIRDGRVRLNGSTSRNPEAPVRLAKDRIEVNRAVVKEEAKVYGMLNKPRGIVTTASDEKGRETVYAYLPEGLAWLAPVGRLDKASEGLLLFTNDSEWAARIAAPESHLEKLYHVQVSGSCDAGLLDNMKKGVRVRNGELLRAKSAEILRCGERNTWLVIVLDEGKNRQIRRLLESLGKEVLRLVRISIGPLELGELPKGSYRAISSDEKQALDLAIRREKSGRANACSARD